MEQQFNIGDPAIFIVNGERIPVTIESVESGDAGTWHDVKLGAAVQGCEAGEIVGNCYSRVSARSASMHGERRSVYPAPAARPADTLVTGASGAVWPL